MEDVYHQLQPPSRMAHAHPTQIADINKDAEMENAKPLIVLVILNVVVARDALIMFVYPAATDLQAVIANLK